MSDTPKRYAILKLNALFFHALCWSLFIGYEIGSIYCYSGNLEAPVIYIGHYIINIALFYACNYLLSSLHGSTLQKIISGLFFYALLFTIYYLSKFALEYMLKGFTGAMFKDATALKQDILVTTFRGLYFTLLSVFYWLAGHVSSYKKRTADAERSVLMSQRDKAQLETKLALARNAYLQQQINPHLLFNTLNFIYYSVYKFSREASHCIILLADIIRKSMEETEPDGKILLSDEIEQIVRLKEINLFRFDGLLNFKFQVKGNAGDFRIIPLVLFTLAENVFKHGDLKNNNEKAVIRITISEEGLLHFFCRNAVRKKITFIDGGSIGLKNTRLRLDFAYPSGYELIEQTVDEIYELNLYIQL